MKPKLGRLSSVRQTFKPFFDQIQIFEDGGARDAAFMLELVQNQRLINREQIQRQQLLPLPRRELQPDVGLRCQIGEQILAVIGRAQATCTPTPGIMSRSASCSTNHSLIGFRL
jgi:hypothetical protein